MAEWYPLIKIAEALDKRKWWWATNAGRLKYINIRVDTRDNCCVVTFSDRHGERFAGSFKEFQAEMDRLDKENEKSEYVPGFQKMRQFTEPQTGGEQGGGEK